MKNTLATVQNISINNLNRDCKLELNKINTYNDYIAQYRREKDVFIVEMEHYAKVEHVPIMDSYSIEVFLGLLSMQKPTRILEIGSAIGYSAIRIAQAFPNVSITTIEQNHDRFSRAVEFIRKANLASRIEIIEADALEPEADCVLAKTYDALFIDAAKGQYKRFFEKYAPTVEAGGIIYCDNMFMDGMVIQDMADIPRRKRTMIRNIKSFTAWIMANPNYQTTLLPVGDGILIAVKK